MPLKVPDAILLTPAGSIGASDEDTSEFLDTEEIYAASKEASISEEVLAAQQVAAKKLASQIKSAEKKLTLDDIEEYNKRVSEASSRSGSTGSIEPQSPGLRKGTLEAALEKVDKDKKEISSDEDEPKKSDSTTESRKGSGPKDLSSIQEEQSISKKLGTL